jgi:hypothetical protein
MVSPPWHEKVRMELVRQGLPPSYIERLVQELRGHFDDLMEEERRMEAGKHAFPGAEQKNWAERMGQPADVAAVAVAEYHRRAFSRKHPVVTFAVFPVLLVFGLWAGFLLSTYAIGEIAGQDDETPMTLASLCIKNYFTHALILAPIAVVTFFFCRFARTNGLDGRWPMTTTAILAIIAGVIWSNIITPGPSHEPKLGLMIGLPFGVQSWLQSMLILAIGGFSRWLGHRPKIVS